MLIQDNLSNSLVAGNDQFVCYADAFSSSSTPLPQCFRADGEEGGQKSFSVVGDHDNRVTDFCNLVVGVDAYNQSVTGGVSKSLTNKATDSDHIPCVIVTEGVTGKVVSFDRATYNQGKNAQYDMGIADDGIAQTVIAKGAEGVAYAICDKGCKLVVRRLTPVECGRLQAMPDWWLTNLAIEDPSDEDIAFWLDAWNTWQSINNKPKKNEKFIRKWLKNPYADSSAYKLYGNGMCFANCLYVLSNISAYANGEL